VGIDANKSTDFSVENTGTAAIEMVVSSSGLPAGISLSVSTSNLSISPGMSKDIVVDLQTDTTAQSGDYPVIISFTGGNSSVEIPLTIQVLPRIAVSVSATSNWAVVGSAQPTIVSIEVANLGDLNDTISLQIDDSNLAGAYGVALDSQTFSLSGGEVTNVNMTITKIDFTSQETTLTLTGISGLDSTVNDVLTLTIFPHQASVNLTAIIQSETVAVGQSVMGTLYVTNKGNSADTFILSTFGLECNLSANSVTLNAGQTHAGVEYSCPISAIILSGPHAFELLATSQADTGKSGSAQVSYNVPSTRVNDAVNITLNPETMNMNFDGGSSVTITVSNLVNDMVSGTLSLGGENVDLVNANWTATSGLNGTQYSLSPGQSTEFVLFLDSITQQGGVLDLRITAVSDVDGQIVVDESPAFEVTIAGEKEPPNGLVLPLGLEVPNSVGLNMLGGGWFVAILLFLYLRLTRKREVDHSEDAMETDGVEEEVDPNETMMLDGRKVICPACSTRCTVPRGSAPPFRFSCPSCGEKIRVTG
ncbi:MAG: hypothetical protein QGH90_00545, partial [Candidatus Poseidoniaceae archaeon]|nr:hypothetical protein [Candidatus Poseidoniaceae archaeon]